MQFCTKMFLSFFIVDMGSTGFMSGSKNVHRMSKGLTKNYFEIKISLQK